MNCQVQIWLRLLPDCLGRSCATHSSRGLTFTLSLGTIARVSVGLLTAPADRQPCKQLVYLCPRSCAPTFQTEITSFPDHPFFQERHSHPKPDLGANLTTIMHNSLNTPFLSHLIVFISTSIQSRQYFSEEETVLISG